MIVLKSRLDYRQSTSQVFNFLKRCRWIRGDKPLMNHFFPQQNWFEIAVFTKFTQLSKKLANGLCSLLSSYNKEMSCRYQVFIYTLFNMDMTLSKAFSNIVQLKLKKAQYQHFNSLTVVGELESIPKCVSRNTFFITILNVFDSTYVGYMSIEVE